MTDDSDAFSIPDSAILGAVLFCVALIILVIAFNPFPLTVQRNGTVVDTVVSDGDISCVVDVGGERYILVMHVCLEEKGEVILVEPNGGGQYFNYSQYVREARN